MVKVYSSSTALMLAVEKQAGEKGNRLVCAVVPLFRAILNRPERGEKRVSAVVRSAG